MSFGSANGDEMHWGTRKKKSSNRKQPVAEPQAVFPKEDPTEELLAALKGLYLSGDYSDLTLSCGGKDYKLHKSIVCPRSEFSAAACRGDFTEAREGRISLPEDDVQIVDLMIYYLYHLDYHVSQPPGDDTQPKEELTGWELPIHVKVYGMAEKYGAAGLKAVAELKFKATANLDWHHNNLIRAAREAYESTVETDRSLRDVVTIKLVNRPKLLELEEVQNLLREVPMLAYDLLMLTYRTQSHLWA